MAQEAEQRRAQTQRSGRGGVKTQGAGPNPGGGVWAGQGHGGKPRGGAEACPRPEVDTGAELRPKGGSKPRGRGVGGEGGGERPEAELGLVQARKMEQRQEQTGP